MTAVILASAAAYILFGVCVVVGEARRCPETFAGAKGSLVAVGIALLAVPAALFVGLAYLPWGAGYCCGLFARSFGAGYRAGRG